MDANEAVAATESLTPGLTPPQLHHPLGQPGPRLSTAGAAEVEVVRLQNQLRSELARNQELKTTLEKAESRADEQTLKAQVLQEEGLSLLDHILRIAGERASLPLAATKGVLATLHGNSTWKTGVQRDPPRRRRGLFRRSRRR